MPSVELAALLPKSRSEGQRRQRAGGVRLARAGPHPRRRRRAAPEDAGLGRAPAQAPAPAPARPYPCVLGQPSSSAWLAAWVLVLNCCENVGVRGCLPLRFYRVAGFKQRRH